MNSRRAKSIWAMLLVFGMVVGACVAYAQQAQRGQTSYMPVGIKEPFASIMARMSAAKPGIKKAHTDLLNERYDLSDRPAQGVAMSRGKPVQEGVRSTRSALKRRASCSACSIS